MKYNRGKIKREHGVIKDFLPLLKKLAQIESIQRIIPGRVARSQGGSGHLHVTYSYDTPSGLKYMMKKGGTSQELFVVCSHDQTDTIQQNIQATIQSFLST